jgi:transcriptional regulator with XRE-family HTH domain
MSNWFKGKHKPDLESAMKIARALGVPLDYLADDAQDEPPASEFSEWEVAVVDFIRLMGLDKGEAIRRLATAPPVPARRVADPEPLSDEQLARKYPPAGPYIPPGAPEWPPAMPRKKRPG